MPRFMAQSTHGLDDPERATLPFIVANVAASADQEAIVLLTIEGVWLATKGYAGQWRADMGVRRLHQATRHHRRAPDRWRANHLRRRRRGRARRRDAVVHVLTCEK